MRIPVVCALLLGTALPVAAPAVHAANVPPQFAKSNDAVIAVGSKRGNRRGRDCTPTNGPFGFYGNIWCQPPNDESYLRNLGASWPQETPPNLKNTKPHVTGSDW